MISILSNRAKRFRYDGWGLLVDGATRVAAWTVCTTRQEARTLQTIRPDIFTRAKPVKVKITIEIVEDDANDQ